MNTLKQQELVDKMMEGLSVEEMVGQILNFHFNVCKTTENFEKMVERVRPGGIFFPPQTKPEVIKEYTEIANRYSKIPVIVSADTENGPGCAIENETYLPTPMAWGACNDAELIEKAGRLTGEICRKNGVHWSFAPVVDINYNKDNPVTNTRSVSDKPEQVAKIAGAYVRGMQSNGLMVEGCKHFPGDGMDDRNQHFCTTINSLSKDEWMNTYGLVYKKMFESGVASVMVGHIALPDVEDNIDPILGPKPSTLSYNVMTKLLKEELGFTGCVISDAMCMVGASVMCPPDRLSIEFIKAGGDMVLFPLERDFDYVCEAVKKGEISMGRLKDAVRRVLKMKIRARLFEEQSRILSEIKISGDINEVSEQIAEKSITVIRNTQNLIPLSVKKGGKFLIINIQRNPQDQNDPAYMNDIVVLAEELEKRGYTSDSIRGNEVDHHKLEEIKDDYDCILINCRIDPENYLGGSMRINWDNIMTFWRGVGVDHPCVIFTSFGDPYKLYEFPFLRTYVNAYCAAKGSISAFVRVILGEKPVVGKSPVRLKGFFDCEV